MRSLHGAGGCRQRCARGLRSCGATVRAHEIGTTRVSVLFHEGRTYDIEIVTDAAALVEKLEALAGRSLPADASPARLQALLTDFDETFRQRVKIAFDGVGGSSRDRLFRRAARSTPRRPRPRPSG